MANETGSVAEVHSRKGILSFQDGDELRNVFFTAARFYRFEKRTNAKQVLSEFLVESDPVQFDAVRCTPCDANLNCAWYATVVFKGRRPRDGVATITITHNTKKEMLDGIGTTGVGEVARLLNAESGIAFWSVDRNQWESVFFRRRHCPMVTNGLPSTNLSEILSKGTVVEIKALPAPSGFLTKWIAFEAIVPGHGNVPA